MPLEKAVFGCEKHKLGVDTVLEERDWLGDGERKGWRGVWHWREGEERGEVMAMAMSPLTGGRGAPSRSQEERCSPLCYR